MKKLICILIAIIMCVSVLGCNEEPIEIISHDDVITDYDNEFTDSNGFLLKEKKYTFKGANVLIINAQNNTDKNYSVTVEGEYLDSNGNVLKNESWLFEQFAAGYNHYFVFNPEITFDKFVYTINATEYSGEVYISDLSTGHGEIYETSMVNKELVIQKGDMTEYPVFMIDAGLINAPEDLMVYSKFVLFDNTGNIYSIYEKGENGGSGSYKVYEPPIGENVTLPQELTGKIKCIFSVSDAFIYTGYDNIPERWKKWSREQQQKNQNTTNKETYTTN